jgi:hypothetical protein
VDREEIVTLLTALGATLRDRGVDGEMYVVRGAAIALAHDARRSTRDIDAVFERKLAIYEAAADALALRTPGEVLAAAEDVFGDRLEPAARFFVEELFR